MDLSANKRDILIYIFSCVAIFVLIYIPSYFTPFHSDDYAYFLQGLSLEARINHYIDWSGRFIVDYTTSMLLNLFSRPVYMAINSLVAVVVLVNISLLPKIFMDNKFINSSTTIVLWGAFFLYWLCNPILGETTFWIVGSANYLWTLMWVSFYLLYLLNLLQTGAKPNLKQTVLLVLLGFLVGFSNEGNSA